MKGIETRHIRIPVGKRKMKALVLMPKERSEALSTGVLWLHGGGFALGCKEQVYYSRAMALVRSKNCVVLAPDYRLSWFHPYPAALEDAYAALLYLRDHCDEWGIRPDQLVVMGCSAGGGLTAALGMLARDKKEVAIAFQLPLYPMLDNEPTETSKDNHGRFTNTRDLRLAWRLYLRGDKDKAASPYAVPARQTDYKDLPPTYTFVGKYEAFYSETKSFVEQLRAADVPVEMDVYETGLHSFDQFQPKSTIARQAAERLEEYFEKAQRLYFAEQSKA